LWTVVVIRYLSSTDPAFETHTGVDESQLQRPSMKVLQTIAESTDSAEVDSFAVNQHRTARARAVFR